MSASFELQAEVRSDQGKGASRRLRRSGKVPAILYGGEAAPQPVMLDHQRLIHSLENEAFYSHILTVDVEGVKQQAVLRDLQRHPFKHRILHVDLMRVSETTEIRVQVPLHFLGEDIAPGVKEEGGLVSHDMNDIAVECLPKHLPEFIEVDISALNIGDSIHMSELVLPEGVVLPELVRGHDHVVVSIHVRKAEEVDELEAVPGIEEVAEGEEPTESPDEESKDEGEES